MEPLRQHGRCWRERRPPASHRGSPGSPLHAAEEVRDNLSFGFGVWGHVFSSRKEQRQEASVCCPRGQSEEKRPTALGAGCALNDQWSSLGAAQGRWLGYCHLEKALPERPEASPE